MIPKKQPSQVMSGPGFSIKNRTKQAGFAVPHSSLTIGLVGLGFGLVWVGVGSRKNLGLEKNLGPKKSIALDSNSVYCN